MEKSMARGFRTVFIGLSLVTLVALGGLAGCSGSGNTTGDTSSNQQSEGGSSDTTQDIAYFEEAPSIPTPDSVTNAEQTSEYSTSGSGGVSYTFSYSADEADCEAYVALLEESGLTLRESNDGAWDLIDGEKKIATSAYANGALTVEILATSEQTTLKDIKLEQTVQTDSYTYTIHSFSWEKEIYPPNTSGYYQYMQEVANFTYLKFEATFKNEGTNNFDFDTTDAYVVFDDGTTYAANMAYVADQQIGDGSDNTLQTYYALSPKQEVTLYIYASVADEIMNAAKSATLSWSFSDGNEYSCEIGF